MRTQGHRGQEEGAPEGADLQELVDAFPTGEPAGAQRAEEGGEWTEDTQHRYCPSEQCQGHSQVVQGGLELTSHCSDGV